MKYIFFNEIKKKKIKQTYKTTYYVLQKLLYFTLLTLIWKDKTPKHRLTKYYKLCSPARKTQTSSLERPNSHSINA